jgi:uncharacterized membrane protein YfcA
MFEFSEIQSSYYLLPLIGFVIGIFGTILGGGGGFFFIPILTLWLAVPAQTAVMTSLVATLPITMVGSVSHYRRRNIDVKVAAVFIAAGLIGAVTGARITGWITEAQLRVAFGIYSIIMGVGIVLRSRKKKEAGNHTKVQDEPENNHMVAKGSFYGLVAGTITGAFGTSGTMPVIAGLYSMKIPLKVIIGTSLLVVLFNSIFAIGAHLFIGKVDVTLVAFLTAGSVIGALGGPGILSRMKIDNKAESTAALWYASTMVIIGILMILGRN